MAKFQYRLQKVVEIRERKVKQQEQKVIEARLQVQEVEQRIAKKKHEIIAAQEHMKTAAHTLMEFHDRFIHRCHEELDILAIEKQEKEAYLLEQSKLLVKYQADVEALTKHKEKAFEEWKEEEKRAEMKILDEVASQRYFRAQQEARDDYVSESMDW